MEKVPANVIGLSSASRKWKRETTAGTRPGVFLWRARVQRNCAALCRKECKIGAPTAAPGRKRSVWNPPPPHSAGIRCST